MTVTIDGTNGVTTPDVEVSSGGSASAPAITITGDTNTGIFFPAADTIAFAEGGAEAMRIDSSGNVGIGLTSPTNKLTVQATSASGGLDLTSSGTAFARFGITNPGVDSTPFIGSVAGNDFVFRTNNTERARITSTGNLYVNTTTNPSVDEAYIGAVGTNSKVGLSVVGGAGPWAVKIGTTDTSANRPILGVCNNSGATLGGITTNGTNVTYGGTSDYRLKENIAPLTGALAKVLQLNPVTYTWKENGLGDQGFIAHELQEVFPNAVAGDKDAVESNGSIKPQMVDAGSASLIATLTAAIQELKAINDAQASRIETLEAKVAALEAK